MTSSASADRVGQQRFLLRVDGLAVAMPAPGTVSSSGCSGCALRAPQHVEADARDDRGQPAAHRLRTSVTSARSMRSQASWTASSASLNEPSMR